MRYVAGPICTVTLEAYKAVYGKEPAEESNTGVGAVVGSRSMFGWKEEDGVVDNFPTDNSEKVFFGDSVLVHDEVHINPCYTWCVHNIMEYNEKTFVSRTMVDC